MASTENMTAIDAPVEHTIESAVEHAKRAFALKKFEQAIEHYATALELITKKVGEDSPEIADLYFSYGKALLENAISQSSVLGKEQPEEGQEPDVNAPGASVNGKGPILSFSGDAEDIADGDEEPAVDLFAHAAQAIAEAEAAAEGEDDDEDEAEPEDDFNAAWEVLDLARAIYDKQKDEEDDDEIKLKLADTYIALGDVSLETEKFDQAITDYEAGLALKVELLPLSSRQIAEAHYKLSMVLDLTSGRLADAIVHAEKALESVESRLAELRHGLSGQLTPITPEVKTNDKGKGKSTGTRLVRDDLVQNMSKSQIEAETKELSSLREDLALKVDELKTAPSESVETSAPALAAQALDKELNTGASSSVATPIIVHDLTSIVKKKKAPSDSTAAKRKANVEEEPSGSEKKPRMDTPES
ncbi:NASP-related protein sim3 [Hypsizygus marmoreus]|uniref:NASP-related protein sim3 n=1 Tax=Hypsizygus marmoreus TaxID=39966 RepID=A0A369JVN9_HYPMA|nr:NASP-related protein sim3 [Hypsizygus marmoreus]